MLGGKRVRWLPRSFPQFAVAAAFMALAMASLGLPKGGGEGATIVADCQVAVIVLCRPG